MTTDGELYERDPEAWNAYLAEGNAKQARKRVSADAIVRSDHRQRLPDASPARVRAGHDPHRLHQWLPPVAPQPARAAHDCCRTAGITLWATECYEDLNRRVRLSLADIAAAGGRAACAGEHRGHRCVGGRDGGDGRDGSEEWGMEQ